MSLYRKIQSLKVEIAETERLLQLVGDHPLMSASLQEKLKSLHSQLANLPTVMNEPKVNVLFSGDAVSGSDGIKASFIGKAVRPLQEMIKTQSALVRFGQVARRGRVRRAPNAELFLTALPRGSFGVELTQLNTSELFDGDEVGTAIKQIMDLIVRVGTSDEHDIERTLSNTPRRIVSNLKRFLKEVADQHSIIEMESGEKIVSVSSDQVATAYRHLAEALNDEEEEFLLGVFRGLTLDTGRFDMIDDQGGEIGGTISPELTEDELIEYERRFINERCQFHLRIYRTKYRDGREAIEYELLDLSAIG